MNGKRSDGARTQNTYFSKLPYQFQERSVYSWVTGGTSGAPVFSSMFYRCQKLLKPQNPTPLHLHSPTLKASVKTPTPTSGTQLRRAMCRGAHRRKVLSNARLSRRRARFVRPVRPRRLAPRLRSLATSGTWGLNTLKGGGLGFVLASPPSSGKGSLSAAK